MCGSAGCDVRVRGQPAVCGGGVHPASAGGLGCLPRRASCARQRVQSGHPAPRRPVEPRVRPPCVICAKWAPLHQTVSLTSVGYRWDQPDLGPCGGLVETYEAWCNYYQLKPNHGLVQNLSTLSLSLSGSSLGALATTNTVPAIFAQRTRKRRARTSSRCPAVPASSYARTTPSTSCPSSAP